MVDADTGLLKANRRGDPLRVGWQDQSCVVSGKFPISCAQNSAHRHQCAKCLSTDHGANTCTKSVQAPTNGIKNKGKGKAGGKGKAKA